jgi:hypothetical protein
MISSLFSFPLRVIAIVFIDRLKPVQCGQGSQGAAKGWAAVKRCGAPPLWIQQEPNIVVAAEPAAIPANTPVAISIVHGNEDLVYFERIDGPSANSHYESCSVDGGRMFANNVRAP